MSKEDIPIVGIDLGTTNCCVAVVENGSIIILKNGDGDRITPSYVYCTKDKIIVGKYAEEQLFEDFENVIFDSKRLIGRKFSDIDVQNGLKFWPFNITGDENNMPVIKVPNASKIYRPEEISAELLKHMIKIAQKHYQRPITNAVITVPAYFNYYQRKKTKEAGILAGLENISILSEPSAATLVFVHTTKKVSKVVLIYDLGGGTFDVLITKITDNNSKVIAVSGDTHLGGNDFDKNLSNIVFEKLKTLSVKVDSEELRMRVLEQCKKEKHCLSSREEATLKLYIPELGKLEQIRVTREEFENANYDLFNKTLIILNNCLSDAKLTTKDIDDIILVGGSTRIPKIQEMLKKHFNGKELTENVDPDEVVAYGAALHGMSLDDEQKNQIVPVLEDVTPLSLGVNVIGGVMSVMIPRNTPIPTKISDTFVTAYDKQTMRKWDIYEGERPIVKFNTKLGTCSLTVPPQPPGTPIDLFFSIDRDGILQISTEDVSGTHFSLNIDDVTNDIDSVNNMLEDAKINELYDSAKIEITTLWKELRNYCVKIKTTCAYDKTKMSDQDKSDITKIADVVLTWTQKRDSLEFAEGELKEKRKEVESVCEPILKKYKYNIRDMAMDKFNEFIKKM